MVISESPSKRLNEQFAAKHPQNLALSVQFATQLDNFI